MLDLNNLPVGANVQTFTGNTATAGDSWQIWNKPRGCSQIFIFLVGNGGNGGTGANAAAASSGGSGGGSSSQSILMINARMIPDILYLSLTVGPEGGSGATASRVSRISIYPDTSTNNTLLIANSGVGAANSTTTAGTGGAVAAIANMPLAGMGHYTPLVGQNGASSVSGAAGNSVTLPTTGLRVTGGAGGGGHLLNGAGFAGGSITGVGVFPTLPGGALGAGANGERGSNGCQSVGRIPYFMGGAGGGGTTGNTNFAGGSGSAGSYGCGGGGGGAGGGNVGAPGGGGRGGDAFCYIMAW